MDLHNCYQRDSLILYSELTAELQSLKIKDEAVKCLYSLTLTPPVRDYELSFYFDATAVRPCESIANNNVGLSVRWSCGLHSGSIGF